jgi:hypothetical protein
MNRMKRWKRSRRHERERDGARAAWSIRAKTMLYASARASLRLRPGKFMNLNRHKGTAQNFRSWGQTVCYLHVRKVRKPHRSDVVWIPFCTEPAKKISLISDVNNKYCCGTITVIRLAACVSVHQAIGEASQEVASVKWAVFGAFGECSLNASNAARNAAPYAFRRPPRFTEVLFVLFTNNPCQCRGCKCSVESC